MINEISSKSFENIDNYIKICYIVYRASNKFI